MSTCNFSLPNTSKHYVVGMNEDNDFWYDDALENMQCELEAIGGETCDGWMSNDTRKVARFWVDFYDRYCKCWDGGYIYVTLESGYYEGAMFDIDRDDLENFELSKTTERRIQRLCNKIEKVLARNTMHIRRIGVFSNGEGIYELA